MSNCNKFIVIGAGQHCSVVLYNAKSQGVYNPIAILDADTNKTGQKIDGVEVFHYTLNDEKSLLALFENFETNKFFIGFGNMRLRQSVFNRMVSLGFEPINIFHPNAVISPSANIGKGVLVECGCLITPSPTIGNNVVVNTGSQVNHDNIIADHVYIASGVILSGGVSIGKNTLIDDGVIVSLGRKIGENCIIGAGSVVTKDIPDNVVAYGAPCRIIRPNK